MAECNQTAFVFEAHFSRRVVAQFDGARMTTDGGALALSAITVVELTHGIYRAKSEADRQRRHAFVEELIHAIPVHPVTLELAQFAGRIEGEQAAKGMVIALPDLLIGATALKLGYSVATQNSRHFQLIPGLSVIQL
jgi:tRNA(fMet)-specific endonuclease VapC